MLPYEAQHVTLCTDLLITLLADTNAIEIPLDSLASSEHVMSQPKPCKTINSNPETLGYSEDIVTALEESSISDVDYKTVTHIGLKSHQTQPTGQIVCESVASAAPRVIRSPVIQKPVTPQPIHQALQTPKPARKVFDHQTPEVLDEAACL